MKEAALIGNNFLFDMGQLYLLKYFTDIIILPAAAAGGVFAVAKIWDAFADIAVGTWVDNRKKSEEGESFVPLYYGRHCHLHYF